jgi:hydrogenase maturation factor
MLKHEVSSMHDVTEGGVLGAVAELCKGGETGAVLHENKIPVSDVTRKICARLGLNPYKLLSSGSLLCTVKKPKPLIEELQAAGIEAAVIGKIAAKERGVIAVGRKGVETPIETEPDELNKIPL